MGIFSSSNKQKTENITDVDNTSVGFQDVQGPAIYGSGNVLTLSDQGAIASAFDYGNAALDLGRDSLDTAAQFAGRAGDQAAGIASESLGNSRDALRDSLDFGEAAIDRFAAFGDNALYSYGDISSDALARVSDSGRAALDFARGKILQTA